MEWVARSAFTSVDWTSHYSVLKLKVAGTAGHGSLLLPDTAGVKLNYVLNKLTEFRESQIQRLKNDKSLSIGDVTTVNLTQLSGGVQSNVVPPLFEAIFDIRLAITLDLVAFEREIRNWCEEAGGGIDIEFPLKEAYVAATRLDDSNPYWLALKVALDELWVYVRYNRESLIMYPFSGVLKLSR